MLQPWVIALVSGIVSGILLLTLAACIVFKFRRKTSSRTWQFGGVAKQESVKPKTQTLNVQPRKLRTTAGSDVERGISDDEADRKGLTESKEDWGGALARHDSKDVLPEEAEVKWKIWAKIGYHPEKECVECTVFRASTEPITHIEDPQETKVFTQVTLLPDETTTQTSQMCPNNGSPSIDETFYFNAPAPSLDNSGMRLSLYEHGADRTRKCLGHTLVDFDELSRTETCFIHLHRVLKASPVADNGLAEIMVSLCYNGMKQTLAVAVAGIRNVDSSLLEKLKVEPMRLKVEVIVGSRTAKSKFGAASSKLNRICKWSYNFGISPKHMDATCFRISLVDAESSEAFGHFIIGPLVYARGTGLEHWKTMLAESRKPVERWHTLNPGPGHMNFGV